MLPVERILQMAEYLFGDGVVQAVALAAHLLADAQLTEPIAPPLVLALPSHVRMENRVRAFGQPVRVEVTFEQVGHMVAGIAFVQVVALPRVRSADTAP